MKQNARLLCGGLLAALLMPLATGAAQEPIAVQGAVMGVHDPSIAREGNHYYIFTTGRAKDGGQIPIRCSEDRKLWRECGQVLPGIPDWVKKLSPGTHDLWAPDVSYFAGKFHLYYAFSSFGSNESGIGLLTNETLDAKNPRYQWKDEGLVVASHREDDFNAIDANIVLDAEGQPWMSLGSFWTGIKMWRINPATGKLAPDAKKISLAGRPEPAQPEAPRPGLPADWQAEEAPFVVHHEGYYYLFVSFDLCCRGSASTYRTMVGRSKEVTGPYMDEAGRPMLAGGGSELLVGDACWKGPGGESILQAPEGDLIVFHAYEAKHGWPGMQISTLAWVDGWPKARLGACWAGPDLPPPHR